ncbi:MAG: Ig-like domain-containing protein [Gemmatimonadaceae bacterium]|nr:Ig-like domain-containing protein [Gemmatimonadaceae bacterium]
MRPLTAANVTPRLLVGAMLALTLAACSGDTPATAPVLPDPETPGAPSIPVASVTTSLSSDTVWVGTTTQAQVVLRSSTGLVLTGRAVSWSSSASAVATVDSTGRVTALSEGSAQITGTSEGVSGSATITVRIPVASVTINAPLRQKVGEPYALEAIIRTADRTEVQRGVTWRVRDTALATITSNGVLTPKVEGAYMVEADVDGRTWGRGFTSYDWGSTSAQDAILWSEDALRFDDTDRLQLLSLTCGAGGSFGVTLGLYGTTAAASTVQYAIDDDTPVSSAWTIDADTQRWLALGGTNAEKLAFADRLATARKLTLRFTIAGGQTETLTWRVTGLAPRLATFAAGCR